MFKTLSFSVLATGSILWAQPQPQSVRRPLAFEPNRGQAPARASWIARAPGCEIFLTSEGVTMMVQDGPRESGSNATSVIRMKLTGSRSWDIATGLEPTGSVSNYFLGSGPNQWHTDIPQYARLIVIGVYDGIDLLLYSREGNLEYGFVIAPGADPGQVGIVFEGAREQRIDEASGEIILTTAHGSEVRHQRPKVFQKVGGYSVEAAGSYVLPEHPDAETLQPSGVFIRKLQLDGSRILQKLAEDRQEF